MAAALAAAAIILAGAYWVVSRNAVAEATRNAEEIAAIDGRGIVAPALSDSVIAGDAVAVGRFDQNIREHVLSARVVRVKLWTPAGKIVYSDAHQLIGSIFPLGERQRKRRSRAGAVTDTVGSRLRRHPQHQSIA